MFIAEAIAEQEESNDWILKAFLHISSNNVDFKKIV
jgi:hypothetical protein